MEYLLKAMNIMEYLWNSDECKYLWNLLIPINRFDKDMRIKLGTYHIIMEYLSI